MRTNTAHTFVLATLLSGSLCLSGCKSNPAPANQPAPSGPRAVQPGQPVTGAAPTADQPSAPGSPTAPAVPAPVAAPAPVPVTAPSGTPVTFRTNETLSSLHNQLGDHFTGSLERPIESRHVVVFAAGAPISGQIVAIKGKGRFAGAGDLGLVLTEIDHHRVETSEFEKVEKGQGKRTGAFIGGGAGVGALIGGLAGGGKGAVIGGLAGAGAGTAGAATGKRAVVLPAETVVTVRLTTSVTR